MKEPAIPVVVPLSVFGRRDQAKHRRQLLILRHFVVAQMPPKTTLNNAQAERTQVEDRAARSTLTD